MKSRIATLALSGVLALSIVGCGQQPAEEKTEEKVEEKTEEQQSTQQSTQQQDGEQDSSAGFSRDACVANALASVGAGDSATNVSTSDLITGGGTEYYLVEFDLDDTHFRVQVDAFDGTIIDVTESVDGYALNYDDEGNVINTTELDQ